MKRDSPIVEPPYQPNQKFTVEHALIGDADGQYHPKGAVIPSERLGNTIERLLQLGAIKPLD